MTLCEASVVICVRNGRDTIRRQLDALDHQIDAPCFEIVIVDNASTDGTSAVVAEWWNQGEHLAQNLQLLAGGKQPGIPRVRNIGALAARGDLLAFCDADDEVSPYWLAAMFRAVREDELAGGRIRTRDDRGNEVPLFRRGLIDTRYLPHVGNCNCAIRKEIFLEVGGYDESLPRYGFEDVDFSWRVQEAGHPVVYVDEAEIWFSQSSTGVQLKKKFLLGKGRVLMTRRFSQYDGREFTVSGSLLLCLVNMRNALSTSLKKRRPDRRAMSVAVASFGQLWGALTYRGSNQSPDRQLIDSRAQEL